MEWVSRREPWLGGVAVRLRMTQLDVETRPLRCWAGREGELDLWKIGFVDGSLLLDAAESFSLGEVQSITSIVSKSQGRPAIMAACVRAGTKLQNVGPLEPPWPWIGGNRGISLPVST